MIKYRIKHVDTWLEPRGKPDPIKIYFFVILFLLLGVLGALFNQHQIKESRLLKPTTINVKFVEANCQGQSSSGKHVKSPHMFKTYVYSPTQSTGRSLTYKAYDSIPYASKSDCEADLQNANTIYPRTQVWYDQDALWDARWTLDEPSPIRVFWYFSIVAGALFIFGLLEHRRMKHREHDIHNG
jgi:hypothetical protein